MAEISVKLTVPEDVTWEVSASRVQLPAVAGDITILPSRAPLEVVLTNGLLRLMRDNGEVTDAYFVKGGIAVIASDECVVATEAVVAMKDIDLAKAESFAQDEERGSEERSFYRYIADKLKTMK